MKTTNLRKIKLVEVAYSELPKGYCGVWRFEDGLYAPEKDLKYFNDLDRSWTDRRFRIEYE